ncbi:citryl-CoA lyase [Diaphorobacter sp. HDW4A]|uniref:citryl-CoA lyase n=1 Tax=Diaphorobacter sp. HDW4A TaxID=2714924 RepID=UPI00140CB0E3|nr:citryl-CoA lyase [Diaphorobacter sp. HDW4A]QIL79794.1 citryl-CoA lyase [Diaphorobacter sp. HDW4A]
MAVKTEIGYTTPDVITVRGKNLSTEIFGKFDFVDMIYWLNFSRMPEPREKAMANLILVAAADHGLTPSALSARLTFLGAPESVQGAIASGLLGAGSRFLGTVQNVAEMLKKGAEDLETSADDATVAACALRLVRTHRETRTPISGLGHNIHVHGDPRVPVLRDLSEQHGFYGKHWRLALAIPGALEQEVGKRLPLNGAGALGAIIADMGLDGIFGRGLMLVGRAAGLVAHVREEAEHPTGQELWDLVLDQDPRNVKANRTK